MASPAADPRWLLLRSEVDAAMADLALAIDLERHELREATADRKLRLIREKAFQKLLQDGYSSLEKALTRVLGLFQEPLPRGRSWHPGLILLATSPGQERDGLARPPFAPTLFRELETLRRFRHVAVHAYANFDVAEAAPAVAAAERVVAALPDALRGFARATGLLPPDAG